MPDTLFLSHPEILIKQGDIKMVHQILIFDDENVDVVDVEYFCSNTCARESEDYAGWSGCHELHHQEKCKSCGKELHHENENADNSII